MTRLEHFCGRPYRRLALRANHRTHKSYDYGRRFSRDEEPELYWTIFALQIMGLLTGVVLLLFFVYAMMTDEQKRERIARRIAQELRDGFYVNLGIGMPTQSRQLCAQGIEVVLQSEKRHARCWSLSPRVGNDADLINAGKETVTELPGSSYFSSADSFGMIRGRPCDLTVLGA